jgi:hypothetical protein
LSDVRGKISHEKFMETVARCDLSPGEIAEIENTLHGLENEEGLLSHDEWIELNSPRSGVIFITPYLANHPISLNWTQNTKGSKRKVLSGSKPSCMNLFVKNSILKISQHQT